MHVRAFLVASVAYFNLSHPASAAYTESWMSDQDVKAYSQQVQHAPAATRRSSTAKPAQQPVGSQSAAPAAAHADTKPASKAPAAAAKARKVQHAGKADPKRPVVAKPKGAKGTLAARAGAAAAH